MISQRLSSVSTQAHTLELTQPQQPGFICWGTTCALGGRKPACSSVKSQASRTGLFPNLMWGEKESIKLPPWTTSPSLLPDPCCRTASKEHLGPTEVKESMCPDMCSPWLSFFSPTADPYQPWGWRGFQKKGQHPGIFLALSSVYSKYLTLGEVSCVLRVQTAYSVEVLSTNQNAGFGF